VNLAAEIFRAYDIRGIAGRTLTPEVVRAIGRALGSMAPDFAVGRDGRASGPQLADALCEGLRQSGANVIDIGMAPTPVVYFAAHHLGCGSCVFSAFARCFDSGLTITHDLGNYAQLAQNAPNDDLVDHVVLGHEHPKVLSYGTDLLRFTLGWGNGG